MMESVSPAQANFLMGKASYETGRFEEAASYFKKRWLPIQALTARIANWVKR